MMKNNMWWWTVSVIYISWLMTVKALTVAETKRLFPATPAVWVRSTEFGEESVSFIEQQLPNGPDVDVRTPGVVDGASDAIWKHFAKPYNPPSNIDVPYLPWHKKKKKYFGATLAQKAGDMGVVDPKVDKESAQEADPSTIQRECPREICPKGVKCPGKNMHCCKSGNFSFCCPNSATCVKTKVPMCLTEPPDDPKSCTSQYCMTGYHCPLSKQGECCLGGRHCCPYSAKCTGSDPPTCKRLSNYEVLTKPQLKPQAAVTGIPVQGTHSQHTIDSTPFQRTPIAVVSASPKNVTNATVHAAPATPVPTSPPQPGAPAKASNMTGKRMKIPEIPCPKCDRSLFPSPPSEAGTRTRQKAFIITDPNTGKRFRILITEVQTTKLLSTGALRTKTRRVKSIYEMPKEGGQLEPDADVLAGQIARSMRRMKVAAKAGMKGAEALKLHDLSRDKAVVKLKEQLARTKQKLLKVMQMKKLIPTHDLKSCGCQLYVGEQQVSCMKSCKLALKNLKNRKLNIKFGTMSSAEKRRRSRLMKQQSASMRARHAKRIADVRRLLAKNVQGSSAKNSTVIKRKK